MRIQCAVCMTYFNEGERHACVVREPILREREKTHGDFRKTSRIALELKHIFRRELGYNIGKGFNPSIDGRRGEALDMIATKLARILSGSEDCKDHWDDIAGYAKLGSEACDG